MMERPWCSGATSTTRTAQRSAARPVKPRPPSATSGCTAQPRRAVLGDASPRSAGSSTATTWTRMSPRDDAAQVDGQAVLLCFFLCLPGSRAQAAQCGGCPPVSQPAPAACCCVACWPECCACAQLRRVQCAATAAVLPCCIYTALLPAFCSQSWAGPPGLLSPRRRGRLRQTLQRQSPTRSKLTWMAYATTSACRYGGPSLACLLACLPVSAVAT